MLSGGTVKKTRLLFIGLMLIFALFGTGIANANDGSDSTTDSSSSGSGVGIEGLEIRSSIIATDGIVISADDFSGFWYDFDDNICSEIIKIPSIDGRIIPEEFLVYATTIVQVPYAASFSSDNYDEFSALGYTYPSIGFFGEKYITTSDDDASELVKLLVDTDDKHTLQVGSSLDLSNGFALTARQVDVEGNKVWLELSKDGVLVSDEVIDISAGPATWDYDKDIGDQDDVIVFRVLVSNVFQGVGESTVTIEGLWLVAYEDILEIGASDEFGGLEVDSVSDTINMLNIYPMILNAGETVYIAENMMFKVADSDVLRFYLVKEYFESGDYEIRGTVATGSEIWTPANFGGFFYELDDDIGSEELAISSILDSTIPEGDLTYTATIQQADYVADFNTEIDNYDPATSTTYPVIGLFGEKYVSLSDDYPGELVGLLVDSNENYTLRTGTILELPNNYALVVKEFFVEGDKVWLELYKDNVLIDDEVIVSGDSTWTSDMDIGNQDDVIIFRAHINDISEDAEGSFVSIDGLYLVDHQNVLLIEPYDEFGILEVSGIYSGMLEMSSISPIVLGMDSVIDVAEGISFKVADDSSLRFYPFVEVHNVEDPSYLKIESSTPSTTVTGSESSMQVFAIDLNRVANIEWFLDGESVQENPSSINALYYAFPPSYGEHIVEAIASNENYSISKEWKWIVQKDPITVENCSIRSSVYTGSSGITIMPVDFGGFWYDIDDNLYSEILDISSIDSRTIAEGGLAYSTSIVQVEYEADFANEEDPFSYDTTYPVISLFGNKYVPTDDSDAGDLVKLLLDSDDKYTLKTGSALELAGGYKLTAKQVNVDGDKVWMELSKDGVFIEDEVIDVTAGEATWDYDVNVGDQSDVIVFRCLITDVFQGQVDSLAVVEGLWLLDYENILEIESSDEFGELEVDSVSYTIEMFNSGPLTLNKGETVDIAEGLKFKVADDNDLRFYLMNECTESGTYQLRGDVATGPSVWTAQNFAGFMYDLDDGISSETLSIFNIYGRVIEEEFLVYNTLIVQVDYEANFASENSPMYSDTYPALGLFGEKYVSLSDTDSGELVKLLIDSNDNHVLRTGSAFELSNGYELTAKQIDVEGDKVWMELSKDGVFIEDEVIDVTAGEATWDYDTDVGSQTDVIVSRVRVSEITEDSEGSFVVVDGLYLIDYQDILSIEPGDEFGELEVDSVSDTIVMYNSGTIVLSTDHVIEFAPGLYLRVADDSELRYYPFVEYEIMEIVPNEEPTAAISSILPNPATEGESVSFAGSGIDSDGTVTGYYWRSSIDGWLSSSASFSISELSFGTHTIYFKVQDDSGDWSDEVSTTLTINEVPNEFPTATITSISPNTAIEGTLVSFVGTGVDNDGTIIGYNWTSSIDGQLSTSAEFSISGLSVGTHTINFKVQDDDGEWSDEVSTSLTINEIPNEAPTAIIISITPNPAKSGASIELIGSGNDDDGSVVAYEWISSIDDNLGNTARLSISSLSVGTHTISFRVLDDDGSWSDTILAELEILDNSIPTATIISIPDVSVVGESVTFSGEGTDTDGSIVAYNWRSSIDGQLSTNLSFSISSLSVGEHMIYFKVQDNDGAWSSEVSENIIVDDGNPFVDIYAGFDSNISINNPVSITLNASDMYPGITEFTIMNNTGELVLIENVTDSITSGEYTFSWNTTGQSGEILPSGNYILNLTSTDTCNHSSSEEIMVVVDNTVPTISIDNITGSSTQGNFVYANSDVVVNVSVSSDVNYMECILNSVSTSYRTSTIAEFIDGKWVATFDISSIDEGNYELTVNANDAAKNANSTVSDVQVIVDHTSPVFSSTTSKYNDTHRKISVTASESIIGYPVVEVNSELIDLTLESGKWIGYFPIGAGSLFTVNVTGMDFAGNIGDSTSLVHVETIIYENGQSKFNSSESGISIIFNGTNGTTGTMVLTESEDLKVNLTECSIGLYFLDVDLDDILAANMSGALIAVPVNSLILPDGMSKEDISICYYNESAENWDSCPTSVEIIDGVECWTTYVTHFSIYGIIINDAVAPVLESVTPTPGSEFTKDTTSVDIRFNYSDSQTGINLSSVVFTLDGSDIIDSSLEITSSYASYTATGLSSGSHTASVTVADMAGNSVVFSATFTIASDTVTSSGGSSGSSGGGGGGGGTTGEDYENILVKDVLSIFINKGSHINYEFTKEGNAISSVQFDSLKNSGKISTIVEVLKDRSSFANVDAPGTVYQQMNIWVGKSGFVTPENVEKLLITFKVEKSWLEENNIEASTVNLYRYEDGSWNVLPTSVTEEDDEFVHFESETSGFSPFAIGSEAEVTENADIVEDNSLKSVNDESTEDIVTVEEAETSSGSTAILGVLGGILVLLAGAYFVYNKRS